jgi:hypothetical protein
LAKKADDYYEGWVLQSDEDIDEFLVQLNISPAEINGIIPLYVWSFPSSTLRTFRKNTAPAS